MTATALPDLTITCNSRRRACVIDSELALSPYGLPIAKQLGEWMELWIVREFCHLLETGGSWQWHPIQRLRSERTLQEWDRLRQRIDPHQRPVNFLADVLGDSSLPAGCDPQLISRWEYLAQSLDQLLDARGLRIDPLQMASRDLVALAAARSACIFTLRDARDQAACPELCRTLQNWGIPAVAIRPDDALAQVEATALRQLFVVAGLTSLLWAGVDLCIVHLFVPSAATLGDPASTWPDDPFKFDCGDESAPVPPPIDHLWDEAQAFWYPLQLGNVSGGCVR